MVTLKLNLSAAIISFLLAIPALAVPGGTVIARSSLDAGNIIPRGYIDQVLAHHEAKAQAKARAEWTKAKRALNKLRKRIPTNQGCDHESEWLSRRCITDVSPRAYEDECQQPDGEEYEVDGECPENTVCQPLNTPNGHDPETGEELIDFDILCVPGTPPQHDNVSGNRQYGYRSISASSSETNDVSVQVLVDNASSTVAAEFLSSDESFVVKPTGTLTANLRGFRLTLCQQNPTNPQHNSRQCIPQGLPQNLQKGQFIDFTYALRGGQEVFFFYSIG